MNGPRLKKLNSEKDRIINIIIKDYCPEEVILYGSLSSGDVKNWSDIDIVVIKNTDKSFYERLEEIINLTKPSVGADILVYTPDEVKEMKKDLFFQEEIIKKGKVVYRCS